VSIPNPDAPTLHCCGEHIVGVAEFSQRQVALVSADESAYAR